MTTGILAGLLRGGRRRGDERIALVLQVDNIAVLARCVGLGDAAGVMAGLAARIAGELGAPTPVQTGPRGQIQVMLQLSGRAAAVRLALKLQALCQAGLDLPQHAPTPTISAVLVRPSAADQGDAHLFAEARRHLAARHRATGQVALIAAGPAPQTATLAAPATRARIEPASADLSRVVAFFQPQLCCHSGRVTGFEALARLDHPLRGMLAPADFLPMLSAAEQRQLTLAMLDRGIAALRRWDAAGHAVDTVSLNVPATDLVVPDFADMILWELDRHDIPPRRLVIEVMEDLSPLDMPERVRANLTRLADLGCGIDLDDFGTGYASLDTLRRLRVSRVKIDRSFITGCDRDPAQQKMILAVLALAERLGLDALAEGVETPEEHAFVQQIGFSHAQGYAIARPLPLDATDAFLAAQHQQAAQLPLIPRRAG